MKTRILALSATALIGMTSVNAQAADLSIGDYAQAKMTYTTIEEAAAAVVSSGEYSGVGSIFVEFESTATTGFGSLCTASLINASTAVTAAHCIYDYDNGSYDPVTGITFILPSFGERNEPGAVFFEASNFAYNPLYDNADHSGELVSGYDFAAFSLAEAATGYDTYEIFTGDPLQEYLEVGTGTIGGPAGTGVGVTQDYLKRTGSNLYEFYGDEVFSDVGHGVVLADFDDGTAEHDVFGRNLGVFQTGIDGEASSSPGDSGGPSFIDGKIAAVTSFGVTGGLFDGYCGGDSTDPYNSSGTTALRPLSQCTNSSVGEIIGNTLISNNMDFLNAYLAANPAIPEPSTWIMLMAGIGFVGGAMRRQQNVRTTVKFA